MRILYLHTCIFYMYTYPFTYMGLMCVCTYRNRPLAYCFACLVSFSAFFSSLPTRMPFDCRSHAYLTYIPHMHTSHAYLTCLPLHITGPPGFFVKISVFRSIAQEWSQVYVQHYFCASQVQLPQGLADGLYKVCLLSFMSSGFHVFCLLCLLSFVCAYTATVYLSTYECIHI